MRPRGPPPARPLHRLKHAAGLLERPVHSDAAIRGAKDDLLGLKENIIIGHLIPAGSGIYRYAEIDIEPPAGYEAPPPRVEEPAPPQLVPAGMVDDEL